MKTRKSKAFTLIELLVVVIVLGILAKLAVPKMVRVLETRRTTEAEEVLAAVRTEQEKRCVAGNFYTNDFSKMPSVAYLDKANKGNYDYRIADESNAAAPYATASRKGYTLRMYYKTGHLCCDGAEACEKLNKKYPSCSELAEDYATGDECIDTVGAIENCVDRPGFCCSTDPITGLTRTEDFVWSADHGKCVECDRQKKDPSFCTGEDQVIVPGGHCSCLTCDRNKGLTFNSSKTNCECRSDIAKVDGQIFVDNSKDPHIDQKFCGYKSCGDIATAGGKSNLTGFAVPAGTSQENQYCYKNSCSTSKATCNGMTPPQVFSEYTSQVAKVSAYHSTIISFKEHECGCDSCGSNETVQNNSCVCDSTQVSAEICNAQGKRYNSYYCSCESCGSNEVLQGNSCVCDSEKVSAEICNAQGKRYSSTYCACYSCGTNEIAQGTSCVCDPEKVSADICAAREDGKTHYDSYYCTCTCPKQSCASGKVWDSDSCSCVDCDKECAASRPILDTSDCSCYCDKSKNTCRQSGKWFDSSDCSCKPCAAAGDGYSGTSSDGTTNTCTRSCTKTGADCPSGTVLVNAGSASCKCGSCSEWHYYHYGNYPDNPSDWKPSADKESCDGCCAN